jgi:four helix bundle protein
MATIKTFEDLECWQDARKFVGLVYRLTQNEYFKKDFELVKQVRGSAISSMANIAEGFHRNSARDFLKFLDYSRASVAETVSHCYIAFDQQYISRSELEAVKKQADIVGKKVNNFIAYLNSTLTSKKPTSLIQTSKTSKTNGTSSTS